MPQRPRDRRGRFTSSIRHDIETQILAAHNRANTLGGAYSNANTTTATTAQPSTTSAADTFRYIESMGRELDSNQYLDQFYLDLYQQQYTTGPTGRVRRVSVRPLSLNPAAAWPFHRTTAPTGASPKESTPVSIFNRGPARIRFYALCESMRDNDPYNYPNEPDGQLKVCHVICVGPGNYTTESRANRVTLSTINADIKLKPYQRMNSGFPSSPWTAGSSHTLWGLDVASRRDPVAVLAAVKEAFGSWHVRELQPDVIGNVRELRRRALHTVRYNIDVRPAGSGVDSANSQYGWRASNGVVNTRRAKLAEHVRQMFADIRAGVTTEYQLRVRGLTDIDALMNNLQLLSGSIAGINASLNRTNFQDRFAVFDCSHVGWEGDSHTMGGGRFESREVCDSCFEDAVECEDDGTMQSPGHLFEWDDGTYHYDEQYADDDDDNDRAPDSLMAYDTNVLRFLNIDPSFKTSAYGDFHMGVELETICHGYNLSDKVRSVRAELGGDYLVGKRDGSLDDGGIEWVTRPTSLTTHLAKLGKWTNTARGLKAWQPGCCGMHVHIDSRAFTALTLGKFLQFFNNRANVDFIRQIAGRHPACDEQARDYAKWDLSESNVSDPSTAVKAKGGNQQRYTMVNTTNLGRRESERLGMENQGGDANTVEVRIYRASMRKERMLAQLEFTHALVMFCRVAGYRAMTGDAFLTWLRKNAGQYRNLSKWYGINNKHGAPKQGMPAPASTVEPELA